MSEAPMGDAPGAAAEAAAAGDKQPAPEAELGITWKKIEILGRPVSAFITAMVVAAIGFMGQHILSQREAQITERNATKQAEITQRTALEQAEITRRATAEQVEVTKRATKQQDTRVYTELMSRREQADSELRRDMFTAILGEFLRPVDRTEGGAALKTRLLKLELLALNFGDSLSLSPLFLELEKEIVAVAEDPAFRSDPFWKVETADMRTRLEGLARRVSGAQLAALTPVGAVFELDVPVNRVTSGSRHGWPEDDIEELRAFNELDEAWAEDPSWAAGQSARMSTLELRGIERTYKATFSEANEDNASILVELEITESRRNGAFVAMRPTEMSFELNFFNFPMIDNTRLSGDQRFALVMEKFDEENIHVVGISFPGMYASLRDKPFMDDVIANLKGSVDSNAAPATPEDKD